VKIGILKADSVLPQFQGEFGDYPEMFRDLLGRAAKQEGIDVNFATYDVEHFEYPERLDECDGYVITGSKKSVYDDEPWIHRLAHFVRELHETRTKLVGICFGHQMVAHALDGKAAAADEGWGVGVHQSKVVGDEPWMSPKLDAFNLIVSHKDQVAALPGDAVLLAGSEFCPYGMFRFGEHILTFQGHPEFRKGYSKALMEYREEILGEEKFSAGMASLSSDTHEDVIGRWILGFISYRSQEIREDREEQRHVRE